MLLRSGQAVLPAQVSVDSEQGGLALNHGGDSILAYGYDNDYRTGRHCVFALHVHLVFVTKYRRKVFTPAALDDLRTIFASVCADFESELIEMQGEDDHVHLLVNFPRKPPLLSS